MFTEWCSVLHAIAYSRYYYQCFVFPFLSKQRIKTSSFPCFPLLNSPFLPRWFWFLNTSSFVRSNLSEKKLLLQANYSVWWILRLNIPQDVEEDWLPSLGSRWSDPGPRSQYRWDTKATSPRRSLWATGYLVKPCQMTLKASHGWLSG